ncbi:MAG TPA: FAD binding domain-containing protein [Anaerolineae bacterium]|nr:FAD binding domain-containing protein [Anaerolineae bacterium]
MWQAYEMATSVEQALDVLNQYDGQAQIIAGGTDLIIELQEGKHSVECLVDVTGIPGLDRIERQGEWIVLGANVTFRQIKDSSLLQEQARVLPEAAATVGALQIQTVATLAGNLVSSLPAADGSVALLALDAEAEIVDAHGRAWRPVGELFLGPGKSAVDPSRQMVTAIRFPAPEGRHGSAWERIGRRRALVLPILNCAVSLGLDDEGQRFEWARIGLGPVAPVPFRAREAEAFLAGSPVSEETMMQAAEISAGEAKPRTSLLRASKEYRTEVLKVLVHQGLSRAVEQARTRAV